MRHILRLGAVILVLLTASVALAQSGGGYDLRWNVLAAGGGFRSVGGGFTLDGTLGQAIVSTSGGSGFAVEQGFWNRAIWPYQVFVPMVKR